MYKPSEIRSEAEYKAALAEVEGLMEAEPGTEEAERLLALVERIEAYEALHWPLAPEENAQPENPDPSQETMEESLFAQLKESLEQAIAIERGEREAARITRYEVRGGDLYRITKLAGEEPTEENLGHESEKAKRAIQSLAARAEQKQQGA